MAAKIYPGAASQAHSDFEVDITQVNPVPQAVMLPEPAYAPFTQPPLDQYQLLGSQATQPPLATGTSSLQKSFPAAATVAEVRQTTSAKQNNRQLARPEARGSSAGVQVPRKAALRSRTDDHSRLDSVAPAGPVTSPMLTRQLLSPAGTLPTESPVERMDPGGGDFRTICIPNSPEVIAGAQGIPPGGSAQEPSPGASVQKNLLGSKAALGSSLGGVARQRPAAGQPGNPASVNSTEGDPSSMRSSPVAQSPHEWQQSKLPTRRKITPEQSGVSLEKDEAAQHPPSTAQHAPAQYRAMPPAIAASKSGQTPPVQAVQQDAYLPADSLQPAQTNLNLPVQPQPAAAPATSGVPRPQGATQPTKVNAEENACLEDASTSAVPKPLQAGRPRPKGPLLRDLGLPPTGAHPEGEALGPRRMRQPPPAFLSGPCDECGTMGSRKWCPGPPGKACLCTSCFEAGMYTSQPGTSRQATKPAMDPSMRLPENCVDCTNMITGILRSAAEQRLLSTEGGLPTRVAACLLADQSGLPASTLKERQLRLYKMRSSRPCQQLRKASAVAKPPGRQPAMPRPTYQSETLPTSSSHDSLDDVIGDGSGLQPEPSRSGSMMAGDDDPEYRQHHIPKVAKRQRQTPLDHAGYRATMMDRANANLADQVVQGEDNERPRQRQRTEAPSSSPAEPAIQSKCPMAEPISVPPDSATRERSVLHGRASSVSAAQQGQLSGQSPARQAPPSGSAACEEQQAAPSVSRQNQQAGPNASRQNQQAGPSASRQIQQAEPSSSRQERQAGPSSSCQIRQAEPSASRQDEQAEPSASRQIRQAEPSASLQEEQAGRSASRQDQQAKPSASRQDQQAGTSASHQDEQAGRSASRQDQQTGPKAAHQAQLAGTSASHQDEQAGRSASRQDQQTGPKAAHQAQLAGHAAPGLAHHHVHAGKPSGSGGSDPSEQAAPRPSDPLSLQAPSDAGASAGVGASGHVSEVPAPKVRRRQMQAAITSVSGHLGKNQKWRTWESVRADAKSGYHPCSSKVLHERKQQKERIEQQRKLQQPLLTQAQQQKIIKKVIHCFNE